jgi:hypothetical protein
LLAGGWRGLQSQRLWRICVGGLLLIGVPLLLADYARTGAEVTQVAIFAMIPILIVIGAAGERSGTGQGGYFAAAVLGFGGLLFVLPVELPRDLSTVITLLPSTAAAGCIAFASVQLPGLLRDLDIRSVIAAVSLPNALLFLVRAGLTEHAVSGESLSMHLWSGSLALVQLVLLLWLLREMLPHRLAARFFVVPLLTTVEGYAIIRDGMTLRILGGAILTIASAVYLLVADSTAEISTLSLR